MRFSAVKIDAYRTMPPGSGVRSGQKARSAKEPPYAQARHYPRFPLRPRDSRNHTPCEVLTAQNDDIASRQAGVLSRLYQ
jgi:hypothetical protein